MELKCRINGKEFREDIHPGESLIDFLRRHNFWGVKEGCESGECGACLVLVDGVPRLSCIMLVSQVSGRSITTIEGIGSPEHPHPLQTSFHNHSAIQCGYCTPAMILAANSLLEKKPEPTEADIQNVLTGTLCRCTGYKKPVEAVLTAGKFNLENNTEVKTENS